MSECQIEIISGKVDVRRRRDAEEGAYLTRVNQHTHALYAMHKLTPTYRQARILGRGGPIFLPYPRPDLPPSFVAPRYSCGFIKSLNRGIVVDNTRAFLAYSSYEVVARALVSCKTSSPLDYRRLTTNTLLLHVVPTGSPCTRRRRVLRRRDICVRKETAGAPSIINLLPSSRNRAVCAFTCARARARISRKNYTPVTA